MKPACVYVGVYWLFCLWACSASPEVLRRKMEKLAASDLEDILAEHRERGLDSLLSGEPYFEIAEFKTFKGDTARVFRAYAKVNFYYLESLKFFQVRKYRYNAAVKLWDRYDIKLKHLYSSSAKTKEKPDAD